MKVSELQTLLAALPSDHTVTVVNEDGEHVTLNPEYVRVGVDLDYPHEPPAGPEWYKVNGETHGWQRDIVNLIDLSYEPPR